MRLHINSENPEKRKIAQAVEILEQGGTVIYPTDTVYGLGCDIFNKKAVEKIARIRGLDPGKALFSFICSDISQIAEYAVQIDNATFKMMKHNLPGPFTFVLKANNKVPKILKNRKETIGVRIPNNQIILDLVTQLGRPILTTSLRSEDEITEYFTDPEDFYDDFAKIVDLVIDGGAGRNVPSTVIDCTENEPKLIRQGIGEIEF